jgi:hypothetical protein
MNMNQPGDLTARTAITLSQDLRSEGYDVLSDHSPSTKNVGRITSWVTDGYKLETRLSLADIAIVEKGTDRVIVLIEIEETNDRPKNFLGDAMGILLGDHINFGEDRCLKVREWTTLIILGKGPPSHRERNCYLQQKITALQPYLGTGNASIGKIFIENYSDESELIQILRKRIETAIQNGSAL